MILRLYDALRPAIYALDCRLARLVCRLRGHDWTRRHAWIGGARVCRRCELLEVGR